MTIKKGELIMPQRLSCTRDSFFCIDQNGFPSHYMIATIVASTVVGAIVGGIGEK